MDIKGIRELILTIDKTSIQRVSIKEKDLKIKISKNVGEDKIYDTGEKREISGKARNNAEKSVDSGGNVETEKAIEIKEAPKAIEVDLEDLYVVKSPIVGVYYSASTPDVGAFVKVGDHVKKGDSLCIIEAMKIMNEIQSEGSGEVIEILVENEDLVEYGQPLMKIRR